MARRPANVFPLRRHPRAGPLQQPQTNRPRKRKNQSIFMRGKTKRDERRPCSTQPAVRKSRIAAASGEIPRDHVARVNDVEASRRPPPNAKQRGDPSARGKVLDTANTQPLNGDCHHLLRGDTTNKPVHTRPPRYADSTLILANSLHL